MKKRIAAIFLIIFLTIYAVPAVSVSAEETSNIIINGIDIGYKDGGYFTKNGKSCANSYFPNGRCHQNNVCGIIQTPLCNCMRFWPTGEKATCEVDLKGIQCYGFARYCQYAVYGYHDGNKAAYFRDITGSVSSGECTAEFLKSKLLNCAPATHIRTADTKKGFSHSISIVDTDEDGIHIADCNLRGLCQVREAFYSWEDFAKFIRLFGGLDYVNEWNQEVEIHNHAYGEEKWNEEQPHKVYRQCVCGAKEYMDGEYYIVSYDGNGGEGVLLTQKKEVAQDLTLSSITPEKEGYTFLGWAASDSATSATYLAESVYATDADVTLYAVWEEQNFAIQYDANGGENAPGVQVQTYGIPTTVTSEQSKKAYTVTFHATGGTVDTSIYSLDCTFLGWNTDKNGTGITIQPNLSYMPNANVTLYAVYSNPTLENYPIPSKFGYTFKGWYTAESGGTRVDDATVITEDTTLYAQWTLEIYPILVVLLLLLVGIFLIIKQHLQNATSRGKIM